MATSSAPPKKFCLHIFGSKALNYLAHIFSLKTMNYLMSCRRDGSAAFRQNVQAQGLSKVVPKSWLRYVCATHGSLRGFGFFVHVPVAFLSAIVFAARAP